MEKLGRLDVKQMMDRQAGVRAEGFETATVAKIEVPDRAASDSPTTYSQSQSDNHEHKYFSIKPLASNPISYPQCDSHHYHY